MNDHFYVCSNQLLKSLDDSLDLVYSAAEYILAYEALDTPPSEPLFKSLKATAEMIYKNEQEEVVKVGESDYKYPEGMGYLFALQAKRRYASVPAAPLPVSRSQPPTSSY